MKNIFFRLLFLLSFTFISCSDGGGDSPAVATPDKPSGTTLLKAQTSIGDQFTCFLSITGEIRCWGNGAVGQLGHNLTANIGDGTGQSVNTTEAISIGETARQISSNGGHSCAVLDSGSVRCWGGGTNGRLGYNSTANIGDGVGQSVAAAGDVPIGETATQVSAGNGHSCALLTNGAVRCWGPGSAGRLGYNSTTSVGDGIGQTIIAAGDIDVGETVIQISAGFTHTCALLNTGAIRCWGSGASGGLGYNSTSNIGDGVGQTIIAAGDIPLGGTAIQVSAGIGHTCALLSTGAVRCWGNGTFGRLGHNSVSNIGDGVAQTIIAAGDVPLGETATQISAGGNHTCALLSTGAVRCWGAGSIGRLGYNSASNIGDGVGQTILAAGDIPLGETATHITAGNAHTCAVLISGAVRCWGHGNNGKLGYNATANIGDGSGQSILQIGDVPL